MGEELQRTINMFSITKNTSTGQVRTSIDIDNYIYSVYNIHVLYTPKNNSYLWLLSKNQAHDDNYMHTKNYDKIHSNRKHRCNSWIGSVRVCLLQWLSLSWLGIATFFWLPPVWFGKCEGWGQPDSRYILSKNWLSSSAQIGRMRATTCGWGRIVFFPHPVVTFLFLFCSLSPAWQH